MSHFYLNNSDKFFGMLRHFKKLNKNFQTTIRNIVIPIGYGITIFSFVSSLAQIPSLSSPQKTILAKIENMSVANDLAPLNESNIRDFLNLVHENQDLLKTAGKSQILKQYTKLRNIKIIRDKFTECLGADPMSLELKQKLERAAESIQLNEFQDCLDQTSRLLSAQESYAAITDKISAQTMTQQLQPLNQQLFEKIIGAAARKYTEISYMLPENLQQDQSLINSFCKEKACSQEIIASLKQTQNNTIDFLRSKNSAQYKASEQAQTIRDQMKRAYSHIYSDTNFTRSSVGPAAAKYAAVLNPPSQPPSTSYNEWKKDIEQHSPSSQNFIQARDELNQNNPVIRMMRASGYKDFHSTLSLGSPTVIQDQYDQISANPYEQVYKTKLVVTRTSKTPVSDIGTEISSVNSESILASRDHALKTIAAGMNDLIRSQNAIDRTAEGLKESIKKAILMNPQGAGQILVQNPNFVKIFCESIKSIAEDKKNEESLNTAMQVGLLLSVPVGGTLSIAAATGARSAVYAVAATRGVMIGTTLAESATIGYSTLNEVQNYELANGLQSTCWIQEKIEEECQEARQKETQALQNLAMNGVSLATLTSISKLASLGARSNLITRSDALLSRIGKDAAQDIGDEMFSVYSVRMELATSSGNKDEIAAIEKELESIRKLSKAQRAQLRREYESRKAGAMCYI